MNGQVISIKYDKGFGFIRGTNGLEYFFHSTEMENGDFNDLTIGDPVQFRSDLLNHLKDDDVLLKIF